MITRNRSGPIGTPPYHLVTTTNTSLASCEQRIESGISHTTEDREGGHAQPCAASRGGSCRPVVLRHSRYLLARTPETLQRGLRCGRQECCACKSAASATGKLREAMECKRTSLSTPSSGSGCAAKRGQPAGVCFVVRHRRGDLLGHLWPVRSRVQAKKNAPRRRNGPWQRVPQRRSSSPSQQQWNAAPSRAVAAAESREQRRTPV